MTHAQNELYALRDQFRQLSRWSRAAAQQLQELADDTRESGSPEPEYIQSLIEEHQDLTDRFGLEK